MLWIVPLKRERERGVCEERTQLVIYKRMRQYNDFPVDIQLLIIIIIIIIRDRHIDIDGTCTFIVRSSYNH